MGIADVFISAAWAICGCSFVTYFRLLWMGAPLSLLMIPVSFGAVSLVLMMLDGGRQRLPRVHTGGAQMRKIIAKVPLLKSTLPRLQYPPAMQLLFVAAANVLGKNLHKYRSEELKVKLEGDSALEDTEDSVWIHWLETGKKLAEDAPIVLLVPGLANTKDSLPGNTIYDLLVKKPWRVVTYEKRGVGHSHKKLRVPIFHIFGHPSDFHVAVQTIQKRYPKAPLHFVSYSAGNGLVGSYLREYSDQLGPLYRGSILQNGGEDYNVGCKLRNWGMVDRMVEARLVQFVRNYYVRDNEAILKAHNAEAFAAAMAAENLHEFYLATMRGFSGYKDPDEAEKKINGFLGGNGWMREYKGAPSLGIYTADDPVGWILSDEWIGNLEASPNVAGAVFAHGSHCASYNVGGGRWLDDLIIQWVEALEELSPN